MRVEPIEIDEWESVLPDTGFEVFHAPAALEVLGEHVDGDLRLFAGYKGDQPVGLMPVVVAERLFSTLVFSPPPGMSVPRLGPVLMPQSPKRRKQEKVNRRFTVAVLEEIESDSPLELFRMLCNTTYADPRPFRWQDFDLGTQFTYQLDLDGREPESVRSDFSKSLRRDVRDAEGLDVTVERGGRNDARAIYEQTRARYEEQGRNYPLSWAYVSDLVASLLETDRARIYVARDESGQFLTGITVLYSNDAAYFWQGGTRTVHEGVGLNSLLHWRIIEDIVDDPPRESVTTYDLMGANTERLCQYKSKFGAELVPYYVVESGGRTMALAKKTYQALVR
jgi:hypothetical protein